ncbi:hypothetical protein BV898_18477 [Hypsibius exemplaris]|uniref:Uncharacterized protein n=1 Tax=Hypsibius exemplaris TaxID=2072580 RepID=A0A9X6NHN3_HYPEX|nr:hypothetical protein BV898_18477 [Hypsibius exemplaris]
MTGAQMQIQRTCPPPRGPYHPTTITTLLPATEHSSCVPSVFLANNNTFNNNSNHNHQQHFNASQLREDQQLRKATEVPFPATLRFLLRVESVRFLRTSLNGYAEGDVPVNGYRIHYVLAEDLKAGCSLNS